MPKKKECAAADAKTGIPAPDEIRIVSRDFSDYTEMGRRRSQKKERPVAIRKRK